MRLRRVFSSAHGHARRSVVLDLQLWVLMHVNSVQLNNQFLIYYNSSKPVQEEGKPLPVPAGAINLEHVRT
jgi:hypothetical protein